MASSAIDAGSNDGSKQAAERPIDDSVSASHAVVSAVASVRNEPMDRIGRLYDDVDPDALNALISSEGAAAISIRFEYGGCHVHVTNERVRAIDAGSS